MFMIDWFYNVLASLGEWGGSARSAPGVMFAEPSQPLSFQGFTTKARRSSSLG